MNKKSLVTTFRHSIRPDEKANKERLRLISMDQEQLFTYEVEEWEVSWFSLKDLLDIVHCCVNGL